MRQAFVTALVDLAERDDSVVLLSGDLGFTVLEPFAERFPDRFVNVGVAEQNMLGVATGLAASGHTCFAYSIATFASMRGYEFFRNGAVLHRLPVRVVGVGGGLDYGPNGTTHHALEDVALMRVQPDVTVLAPADAEQARTAVELTAGLPGPAYLRLAKAATPVPALGGRLRLGHVEVLGEGREVVLVTYGGITGQAVAAAERLTAQGIEAAVAVCAALAPAPRDDLAELLAGAELAVSVEGHYIEGGVGSLVAGVIAEAGLACRLVRCGIREMPRGEIGSREYLEARHGLDAEAIAETAAGALRLAP